mgnify:CR=1 FL=1
MIAQSEYGFKYAYTKEVFPIGFDQRYFIFDKQSLLLDELTCHRKEIYFLAASNACLRIIWHRKRLTKK